MDGGENAIFSFTLTKDVLSKTGFGVASARPIMLLI
jgi:hypothetical protein